MRHQSRTRHEGKGSDGAAAAPETDDDHLASDTSFGRTTASFMGVDAYSNGVEPRYNDAPYGQYGIQFQCVEYVNRFAVEALGLANMKGTGNAIDYAGPGRAGFTWVDNDGSSLPDEGDILVFSVGTYGHVAVCTTPSGAPQVRAIEQNTGQPFRDLTVSGSDGAWALSGGGMQLLGWQHVGALLESSTALTAGVQASTASVPNETWTVQSGDTLWGIAESTLGNGARYPEIAHINGLANASFIVPGMVLTLPSNDVTPPSVSVEEALTVDVREHVEPGTTGVTDLVDYLPYVEELESKLPNEDLLGILNVLRRQNPAYQGAIWRILMPGAPASAPDVEAPAIVDKRAVRLPSGDQVDMSHLFAALEGQLRSATLVGTDLGAAAGWLGDLASALAEIASSAPDDESAWQGIIDDLCSPADMMADISAGALGNQAAATDAPATVSGLLRTAYLGERPTMRRPFSQFVQSVGMTPTAEGSLLGEGSFRESASSELAALAKKIVLVDLWTPSLGAHEDVLNRVSVRLMGAFVDALRTEVRRENPVMSNLA
jgi:surface antigen/LysM repeat protein